MKSYKITPSNVGWIQTELDQEHIDYLWERIEEAEKRNVTYKQNLAGNISTSHVLQDKDDYFLDKVLEPHAKMYYETFDEVMHSEYVKSPSGRFNLKLIDFWSNHSYQHEFNPPHSHNGVYSFVVWMKIPTEAGEQHSLPFLNGVRFTERKASNFEFEYVDILGKIRTFTYELDPSKDGTLLFFPAPLRHQVYPFYNCDEARVSISGNLWFEPKEE